MDEHGNCPNCGTSWDGGDIYEVLRAMKEYDGKSDEDLRAMVETSYAPPRRFSRLIGVERPGLYDGVWEWQCPDCEMTWPRFEKGVVRGKARKVR